MSRSFYTFWIVFDFAFAGVNAIMFFTYGSLFSLAAAIIFFYCGIFMVISAISMSAYRRRYHY